MQKYGYDECIKRLRAARDHGADVGLLEGPTSKAMARQVVIDMAPMPLLLNMVEHGVTPTISTGEAEAMGYRIMIFSFVCVGSAFLAMQEALKKLKSDGVAGLRELTPKVIMDVCGMQEKMEIDARAGGTMEKA